MLGAPGPALFPYTTLFRSPRQRRPTAEVRRAQGGEVVAVEPHDAVGRHGAAAVRGLPPPAVHDPRGDPRWRLRQDRKSTRLNSSHPSISYAVFCLKKKNIT